MKQPIFLIIILCLILFSCKKKYTESEINRIEALTANHVYKFKVPDNAFVFCLDTIKADVEYERFSEEFCKRGQEVDSYLYLSSYDIYVPVQPQYICNDDIWYCWRYRNYLTFITNKYRQWLVEDELVEGFNQSKMNSLLKEYYEELRINDKTYSALIHFKVNSIKVNPERDSLYVSLLESYYAFIKNEKVRTNLSLDSLKKVYPFNLAIGEYVELPPLPLPPVIGVIID